MVIGLVLIAVTGVLIAPGQAYASSCGGTAFGFYNRYGPVSEAQPGVFGHPGYKQNYSWNVDNNSAAGIQVRGFDENGRQQWYNVGVPGRFGGHAEVPWGNTLARPAMRVTGVQPLSVTAVNWSC